MKILRIIKSIRRLLFINKLRVILSLIGIAVGITSVIVLVAFGEGARIKLEAQINSMGKNLITIDAGKVKEVIGRRRETSKVTTLKEKDAAAIAEECGMARYVAPTQEQTLLIKYENGASSSRIIGTLPDFCRIRNYEIAEGRLFDLDENKISARVAVVGYKTSDYLFKDDSPVGQTIRINKIPFEIIGTLKQKGSSYDGANEDEIILIPLNTGLRRVFNLNYIKNIYVQVKRKDKMGSAENEIRNILRERHRLNLRNKEDDFTIQNLYTVLSAGEESNKSFTMLITGVATLSLIIGGIGILAVMLLSVKERKPEIGLRMAVGAKPTDVLFQFLLEAIILSAGGGIIGIALGITCVHFITIFTDVSAAISLQSVIISVFISAMIGIIFGTLPARKASLIEPVKALQI